MKKISAMLVATAAVLSPVKTWSQSSTCVTPDSSSQYSIQLVRFYARSAHPDAQYARAHYGIPFLPDSSSVQPVNDEATCSSAMASFNAAIAAAQQAFNGTTSPGTDRVLVIRLGDIYVVTESAEGSAPLRYVSMDSGFAKIALWSA